MLTGYARVSTDDQDLTLQRAALKEAGCKRVFEEKASGAKRDRPELARMLEQLRDGDIVVVTRLDRLARSTRDLLDIAERLKDGGAGLRSLAEPWADTTSPAGRMVLTVFAGIAEFERSLIGERTTSGRKAAQARGVQFGRPSVLTPEQVALGRRLIEEGKSVREVARGILKCHPATLYRELARTSESCASSSEMTRLPGAGVMLLAAAAATAWLAGSPMGWRPTPCSQPVVLVVPSAA